MISKLTSSLAMLILCRFLAGITAAMKVANCSMLVAQVQTAQHCSVPHVTLLLQYSSTPRRGIFLSVFALMVGSPSPALTAPQMGLGVLLSYCLGAVLSWRWTCLAIPGLLVALLLGLSTVPESPIWLLGHRSVAAQSLDQPIQSCRGDLAAYNAIRWLRATEKINQELDELNLTRYICFGFHIYMSVVNNFSGRNRQTG
jgi:MFS family permease